MVLGFGKLASRTRPAAGWGPGTMSPASFQPLVPHEALVTRVACPSGSAELVGSFSSCLIWYVVLRTGMGVKTLLGWGLGTQAAAPTPGPQQLSSGP